MYIHVTKNVKCITSNLNAMLDIHIRYCPINQVFGEGSQISINQKRENSASLLLIGSNLGPFHENTVLYHYLIITLSRH